MPATSVDDSIVTAFFRGDLDVEGGRHVVRDLFAGRRTATAWQPRPEPSALAASFERATTVFAGRRAMSGRGSGWSLPPGLLDAACGWKPEGDLPGAVEGFVAELFADLPPGGEERVDRLLAESYRLRSDQPRASLALAELARRSVGPAPAPGQGSPRRHDLLCRCWSELGRAYRELTDLASAERCLLEAESHSELALGDPLVEAQLCERWALLRMYQGRLDEALACEQRAVRIYRGCGARHMAGCATITAADLLYDLGRTREAIATLRDGVALIDAQRDPRARLAAHHSLALYLLDASEVDAAASLLPTVREMAGAVGTRSDRANLLWLEGKIAAAQGRTWAASQYLAAAGGEATELGNDLDAGLLRGERAATQRDGLEQLARDVQRVVAIKRAPKRPRS